MCKQILKELGFSASERFEGVASGGVIQIYFGNPTGSGRTIKIVKIGIISTGQAYLDVTKDNTVSTAGTELIKANLNITHTNTPVAVVEHPGSYVAGPLMHKEVIPGGSGTFSVGGIAEVGATVMLTEGTNFIMNLTNTSASAEDISVRFLWHETK